MLRSVLLIFICLLSFSGMFAFNHILWKQLTPDLITKQVALHLLLLIASFPLISSSQQRFIEERNANTGLEIFISWGAIVLQIVFVMSSIIHFEVRRENIIALRDYADADISSTNGVISIDGVLGKNAYIDMLQNVELLTPTALIIRSSGGLIDSAQNIASLVKSRSLHVHVHDYCHSACVIIATASPRLTAENDAIFGFHRGASLVSHQGGLSTFVSDQATEELISALRANGIPEHILSMALETPPEQMYYISAVELSELGILELLNK